LLGKVKRFILTNLKLFSNGTFAAPW
jgi:hypothetical protein